MCGIAGILNFNGSQISLDEVKKMTDVISHRGPDGEGQWLNASKTLGLGHRRLSIIDLSENARQPMSYLHERYTITYNGEIYNYVELKEELKKDGYTFSSTSDTEVILAMYDKYKTDCVKYFDGMFSFVLWDEQNKTAFCARDRFGEKPFHYYYDKNRFVFASEIKCFWQANIPKIVNNKTLCNFLANKTFLYDYKKPSETFYENIYRLEPAHSIFIKDGDLTFTKYWNINLSSIVPSKLSIEDATREFRTLLTQSVNKRLRSDVPIGSSLSGGIDSSAIVCIIDSLKQPNSPKQLTFSARFKDFEKDEGRFMEMVSKKTDADPKYIFPDEDMLAEDLENLFYHQDEPTAGASIYAQWSVMSLAKQNHTKVLLDGQGADEILAGYHNYYYTYYYELLHTDKELFKLELNNIKERYPVIYKHFENYLNSSPNLFQKSYNYVKRKFSSEKTLTAIIETESFIAPAFKEQHNSSLAFPAFSTLNSHLHFNTHKVGLQDLLRYADRNSMAHSREVRLPFLDHKIAEFLFSLPSSYKIHQGWTKYPLRKGFENLLPKEIAWRVDKIGYEPPQKQWMGAPKINAVYNWAEKKLEQEGILNPKRDKDKDDKWIIMSVANLYK
jgi:asparagine synthase (glutamine-hydrolysing)